MSDKLQRPKYDPSLLARLGLSRPKPNQTRKNTPPNTTFSVSNPLANPTGPLNEGSRALVNSRLKSHNNIRKAANNATRKLRQYNMYGRRPAAYPFGQGPAPGALLRKQQQNAILRSTLPPVSQQPIINNTKRTVVKTPQSTANNAIRQEIERRRRLQLQQQKLRQQKQLQTLPLTNNGRSVGTTNAVIGLRNNSSVRTKELNNSSSVNSRNTNRPRSSINSIMKGLYGPDYKMLSKTKKRAKVPGKSIARPTGTTLPISLLTGAQGSTTVPRTVLPVPTGAQGSTTVPRTVLPVPIGAQGPTIVPRTSITRPTVSPGINPQPTIVPGAQGTTTVPRTVQQTTIPGQTIVPETIPQLPITIPRTIPQPIPVPKPVPTPVLPQPKPVPKTVPGTASNKLNKKSGKNWKCRRTR